MRRFIPTRALPIQTMRQFLTARDGATAIEYALIASGIAGVLVAAITSVGGSVGDLWTSVADVFN